MNSLQESAPAVIRPTVTVQHFSGNTAHIIVIIPGQLCSSTDVCQCKECHPGETQVMGVYKHILDKHIWTAWMLKQDTSKHILLPMLLKRKQFQTIILDFLICSCVSMVWWYSNSQTMAIKKLTCRYFPVFLLLSTLTLRYRPMFPLFLASIM